MASNGAVMVDINRNISIHFALFLAGNLYCFGLANAFIEVNFLVHCLMMKDHLYVVDPLYKANSQRSSVP